jgi:hypothetical protein
MEVHVDSIACDCPKCALWEMAQDFGDTSTDPDFAAWLESLRVFLFGK